MSTAQPNPSAAPQMLDPSAGTQKKIKTVQGFNMETGSGLVNVPLPKSETAGGPPQKAPPPIPSRLGS